MKGEKVFQESRRAESIFLRNALKTNKDPKGLSGICDRINVLIDQTRNKGNTLITNEHLEEVLNGLSEYGFSTEQIYKICTMQPAFFTCTWRYLSQILCGLEQYGCSHEEVIAMISQRGGLVTSTWGRLHGDVEHPGILLRLEKFGFSKKQLLKALNDDCSFLNNSWQRLHGTDEEPGLLLGLQKYGFSSELLGKMVSRYSSFLQKSWEKIRTDTILPMELYGFSVDEIVTICSSYPNVFNFAWERIHGTPEQPGLLLQLEQNGFTREQAIDWCVRVPAMLTYSWNRISSQLQLATTHDIPLSKELFVQSHQKTAWRFEFLQRNGYAASNSNLFRDHKEFVKRFGKDYEPSAVIAVNEVTETNS